MIIDDPSMASWSRGLAIAVALTACTKPNPRSCRDGTCTDPSLPFCDVDGSFSGYPETCIAVTCNPGEFASCRGDQAVTCNSVGTDYDLVQCPRGCDAAASGCRVCNPGETVCANGKVSTCDASGDVVSSQVCPLGCFEDQPRCREVKPSNGLESILDMVANAPDVDLVDKAIAVDDGYIGPDFPHMIPTFFVDAPTGGVPLTVMVVNSLRLKNVGIGHLGGPTNSGPGFVFLAKSDITIEGLLTMAPGAGGIATGPCVGGAAFEERRNVSGVIQYLSTGSGGGANATSGAKGGSISPVLAGGAAGQTIPGDSLEPLRGGCAAGTLRMEGYEVAGAAGGGALHLVSRTQIIIDGRVDAGGAAGTPLRTLVGGDIVSGGGGGGAILLEAPQVTLTEQARLLVKGGAGGARGDAGGVTAPTSDASPNIGMTCNPSTTYCTSGGDGAAPGVAATEGVEVPYTNNTSVTRLHAGGGGGGLGRIRINTRDGSYVKSSSSIEAAVVSVGTVQTR